LFIFVELNKYFFLYTFYLFTSFLDVFSHVMETNFINEDKEEPSTDNYQSILFISDYYCSRLSSPPNGTPKFMEIWLGFLYI